MPYADPNSAAARRSYRRRWKRYQQRHRRDPEFLYRAHRQNARVRGISFRLTFDQWWRLWKRSGKWKQRGQRSEQYCMARPGDQGAYEIGNVMICRNKENRADRNQNYPLQGENNPAFGRNYWATGSKAINARRIAALSAANSKPKSLMTRKRMSRAAMGRRRVIRYGRITWAYPNDLDYPSI